MSTVLSPPAHSFGEYDCVLAGSFQTNGATSGAVDSTKTRAPRGLAGMTVTQSGSVSGLYTVTMPVGVSFPQLPWSANVGAQYAVLSTDWFECGVLGEVTQSNGQLSFSIQCHRSGTARAPAATAGNRINFVLMAGNNSGK